MPEPTTRDVLNLAADLIEQGGLSRRRFAGPGRAFCPQGAIDRAFRDLGGLFDRDASVPARCQTLLGEAAQVVGPLSAWSDTADQETVVAALRLAAGPAPERPRPVRRDPVATGPTMSPEERRRRRADPYGW